MQERPHRSVSFVRIKKAEAAQHKAVLLRKGSHFRDGMRAAGNPPLMILIDGPEKKQHFRQALLQFLGF